MAKTKIAVSNLGAEELAQFKWTVRNRSDTQMEADALFERNPEVRKKDRAELEKLFIQTPAAVTNAPNLQKQASVEKVAGLKRGLRILHSQAKNAAKGKPDSPGLKEAWETAVDKMGRRAAKAAGDHPAHAESSKPFRPFIKKTLSHPQNKSAIRRGLGDVKSLMASRAAQVAKTVTASVKCICPKPNCPACKKQKTSAIDTYLAKQERTKLSEAQVRFPELLKVAAPAPILPKKISPDAKSGPTPAQSSLSGGSA